MCSPAIIEQVKKRITRRNLLQELDSQGLRVLRAVLRIRIFQSGKFINFSSESVSFSRVIDLSHTLIPIFHWFVAGQEVTTRGKRTFVPPAIVEVKPVLNGILTK